MSEHTNRHRDRHNHPPYTHPISHNIKAMPNHVCKKFCILKAKFPSSKGTGKLVENLQTTLEMSPHDIYPQEALGRA